MKFFVRVENGPDAGLLREIPPEGLSVGRSSQNDLALKDGMLSRHHCRFTLQDGGVVVSDLATVNGTSVNGLAISADTAVSAGDRITIGETVLMVDDGEAEAAADDAPKARDAAPKAPDAEPKPRPEKDPQPSAGLSEPLFPAPEKKPSKTGYLPLVAGLCAISVALAAAAKMFLLAPPAQAPAGASAEPRQWPLQFSYVKTEGSGENVFRYEMVMAADGTVTVRVDDLSQNRHLAKTSDGPVPPDARSELGRAFEAAGFFSLEPLYEGTPRQNSWRSVRFSALVGSRAATVEVRNRTEPESVKTLRERLEAFGRNELGLWAFAFGREKLLETAEEEFARAQRLWAERDVRRDNVHSALRAYRSCIEYLDSLDPKPELHDRAVAGAEEVERALDDMVSDLNWKADHGASVKDWAAARQALRELLDVVPDRTDPRNKAAIVRLRDIESRLSK